MSQQHLRYLMGATTLEVALNNEKRVVEALGTNYPFADRPPWIKNVRLATKDEDNRGKDVVVETTDVGNILIQVKSSTCAKQKFLRRQAYGEVSIRILCVIISASNDASAICRIIMPLLNRAHNERVAKRHPNSTRH